MAKKTIEPSYQTLADLAELFGSCVYQAPAMQQSEKLDEAVLPKESKIFTGRTERKAGGGISVHLDDGQTVDILRNITGREFENDEEVMVMQNTSGEYILVAGGGTTGNYKYAPYTRQAQSFEFNVVPVDTTPPGIQTYPVYTFTAIDTPTLMNVLNALIRRINQLETTFNRHIHNGTASDGSAVTITPTISQSTDDSNVRGVTNDLINSQSSLFYVTYPK